MKIGVLENRYSMSTSMGTGFASMGREYGAFNLVFTEGLMQLVNR